MTLYARYIKKNMQIHTFFKVYNQTRCCIHVNLFSAPSHILSWSFWRTIFLKDTYIVLSRIIHNIRSIFLNFVIVIASACKRHIQCNEENDIGGSDIVYYISYGSTASTASVLHALSSILYDYFLMGYFMCKFTDMFWSRVFTSHEEKEPFFGVK